MALTRLQQSPIENVALWPLLHSPGAGYPLTWVDDPLALVLRLLRTSLTPGHLRPLLRLPNLHRLTAIVMEPGHGGGH